MCIYVEIDWVEHRVEHLMKTSEPNAHALTSQWAHSRAHWVCPKPYWLYALEWLGRPISNQFSLSEKPLPIGWPHTPYRSIEIVLYLWANITLLSRYIISIRHKTDHCTHTFPIRFYFIFAKFLNQINSGTHKITVVFFFHHSFVHSLVNYYIY